MSQKDRVIKCVIDHPGQTATWVARELNLKPSSVSALLHGLSEDKSSPIRRTRLFGGPWRYYSVSRAKPKVKISSKVLSKWRRL